MSSEQNGYVSRRDFLKLSMVGLGALMFPNLPRSLQVERRLQSENVSVDFFFVWHTSEKDLKGFGKSLKSCDVFIPELLEWLPQNEKYLNDVAKGIIGREQIQKDYGSGFFGVLLQTLWGTNKLVRILDVPKDHPLDIENRRLKKEIIPNYNESFDGRKRSIYIHLREKADWMRRREDYTLEKLELMISEIKKENPVKYGGGIKVLMEYGVSHTRLMHLLSKNEDVNGTSSRYPDSYTRFLHSEEALRRFWFADDPEDPKKVKLPDEKLIGHVILEEMLMDWFFVPNVQAFKDTAAAVSWMRGVVNKFDQAGEPEIADLWEFQRVVRKNNFDLLSSEKPLELKAILANKLREKGVDENYIQRGLRS